MTTSETLTVPNLTGGILYSRTVQVAQYEPAMAQVKLDIDIPLGELDQEGRAEAIVAELRDLFFQAKVVVNEQLGIDHTATPSGVVVEMVQNAFKGSEMQYTPSPAAMPAPSNGGIPAKPPFPADTRDKDERIANKEWGIARFASHPDEFFDNRPKSNPKAPDVKHKSSQLAVWFD